MTIIGFVGMILSCVLLVVYSLTSANNKQLEYKIVITIILSSLLCLLGEYMAASTIKDGVISDISDKNNSKPDSDSEELDGRNDTTNLLLGIADFLSIIFTVSSSTSIITCKKICKEYRAVEIDTSGVRSFV